MASYHNYGQEAISDALERWKQHGTGNRMTEEEQEAFKAELDLWCMMERQSWTFKRTPLLIPVNSEVLEEDIWGSDEEG